MSSFPTLAAGWRRARLSVLRRRRPLAALSAALAVGAAVHAVTVPPPEVVPVPVAARALPAGTLLGADDVTTVGFAPGSVPDGVLAAPQGRVLAGPMAAGEPLTAARMVGAGLADAAAGGVAVPVRLPDAGLAALLRVGDVVDLLATDPQAGTTATVARGVRVLALPGPAEGGPGAGAAPGGYAGGYPGGAAVVLEVPAADAADVTDAAGRLFLSYVWAG